MRWSHWSLVNMLLLTSCCSLGTAAGEAACIAWSRSCAAAADLAARSPACLLDPCPCPTGAWDQSHKRSVPQVPCSNGPAACQSGNAAPTVAGVPSEACQLQALAARSGRPDKRTLVQTCSPLQEGLSGRACARSPAARPCRQDQLTGLSLAQCGCAGLLQPQDDIMCSHAARQPAGSNRPAAGAANISLILAHREYWIMPFLVFFVKSTKCSSSISFFV